MSAGAVVGAGLLGVALLGAPLPACAWTFTDVPTSAGLVYQHGYAAPVDDEPRRIAGGVAASDHDADGWVDLCRFILDDARATDVARRRRGPGRSLERDP